MAEFELVFKGDLADEGVIDFYDVARALTGFQRSLAITTHLVLNNEVITQATALKNATIFAPIPEEGSWKFRATVAAILGGAFAVGTADRDTPLGNLVSSAYDYVISESLGFHVDYDKTLGQQVEEARRSRPQGVIRESQFESVIEKVEPAVRDMHRPIAFSATAERAHLTYIDHSGKRRPLGGILSRETFDYMNENIREDQEVTYVGWVSSYNINTFKGRVYVEDEGRSVPFKLLNEARTPSQIARIAGSLDNNARERLASTGEILFTAYRNVSVTGRLKSYSISGVRRNQHI